MTRFSKLWASKRAKFLLILAVAISLLQLATPLAMAALPPSGPQILPQCDVNDIRAGTPYYKTCTSPSCSASGTTGVITGDEAKTAFNYFVSQGLPPFQSAGIVGNMQAESGVQPERLQGTLSGVITPVDAIPPNFGGGWGLVQWTPPGKMVNPTKQAGKDPNDIVVQLDFLWSQLTTGTEKPAGDALKSTTNVDDAAVSFLTKYERPADPSASKQFRISAAEQILKQYGNGAPSGTTAISSGCQPSSSTSTSTQTPGTCAEGTDDLGMNDGYQGGQKISIRLCGVPNISSNSEESTPGGRFYVAGANGHAIVNADMSANFYNLAAAAKAAGISLSATSSFRTMAHQQSLCPCNGVSIAHPGFSNHQAGNAIDFSMPGRIISTSDCTYVSGRCEAPGNPVWEWLNSNAQKYNVFPYVNEFWHWSKDGH